MAQHYMARGSENETREVTSHPAQKDYSACPFQCFTTNRYHPFYTKNSLCSAGQSDRQGQDGRQDQHRPIIVSPTGTGADGVILMRRALMVS